MRLRGPVTGRFGAAVGLTLLWLAGETFASQMPGTALVVGLIGLGALIACVGLMFYALHE